MRLGTVITLRARAPPVSRSRGASVTWRRRRWVSAVAASRCCLVLSSCCLVSWLVSRASSITLWVGLLQLFLGSEQLLMEPPTFSPGPAYSPVVSHLPTTPAFTISRALRLSTGWSCAGRLRKLCACVRFRVHVAGTIREASLSSLSLSDTEERDRKPSTEETEPYYSHFGSQVGGFLLALNGHATHSHQPDLCCSHSLA